MKTLVKSLILCTGLTVALTACSGDDNNTKRETVNTQGSQSLTESGEKLMTPHTLNLANRLFESALQKIPTIKKRSSILLS